MIEVADAYNFKLVGGREAWLIDGEPRPRFASQTKEAKLLAHSSPPRRIKRTRTRIDGKITIDSDVDLQHSARYFAVRPGPDDHMGWTYLENYQRWHVAR